MKRAILLFLLWSVSGFAATTEVRQDRTTRVLVGRSTIVSSNFLGQTTQPLSQFAATTSAELAVVLSDETGSGGGFVRATSPTLTTPALGTPSAVNLANATNLPIATGVSGLGTGVATWLATPSSDNLASVLTDETGSSGGFVRAGSPTFTGDLSADDIAITGNGALSDPALSITGTPITGGTATTTKPLVLIETAGATSAGWNTSGTMLGVNAPSGFGGHLIAACANGTLNFLVTSTGSLTMRSLLTLAASDATISLNSDTILVRDGAANTLALRNSTSAQAFRVSNTYTDSSNNEYFHIDWKTVANECLIGAVANGTGTARALSIQTGGAGGSRRWQYTAAGHYFAYSDNVYDIGASGANRPRNVYIANNIWAGASGSIGWASGSIAYSASSGVITLYNNGATDFGRLQFGGTTGSFPSVKRSATELQVRLADDSADAPLKAAQLTTTGGRVVNRTADTSTSITLTSAHHFVTLNNASPVTCNLPAAASNSGREYWIKNLGAGSVTIDPNSTEQIRDTTSDASTLTLTAGGTCHIICDGTRWERF